jgi:hypothetical protein
MEYRKHGVPTSCSQKIDDVIWKQISGIHGTGKL